MEGGGACRIWRCLLICIFMESGYLISKEESCFFFASNFLLNKIQVLGTFTSANSCIVTILQMLFFLGFVFCFIYLFIFLKRPAERVVTPAETEAGLL